MQTRNLTTNVPKNSRSQIVFRTDIFQKWSLGAPDYYIDVTKDDVDELIVLIVGRSKYYLEISKTWERLVCSSLLRSSSARMKIEMGVLLTASEHWEFFLVLRGSQITHLPPRKFVAPELRP